MTGSRRITLLSSLALASVRPAGDGIGLLSRRYGLSANNVHAIELVTADGHLVRADPMTPASPVETEGVIGRGAEIGVLQSFIERAGRCGEALVLVGDAGVGKTALLDVAARRAISLGVSVVRAAGAEFEAEICFSALHQLLLPLLSGIEELRPLYRDALSVALGLGEGEPRTGWLCRARRSTLYGGQARSSRC